jgi:hypothetical protein
MVRRGVFGPFRGLRPKISLGAGFAKQTIILCIAKKAAKR